MFQSYASGVLAASYYRAARASAFSRTHLISNRRLLSGPPLQCSLNRCIARPLYDPISPQFSHSAHRPFPLVPRLCGSESEGRETGRSSASASECIRPSDDSVQQIKSYRDVTSIAIRLFPVLFFFFFFHRSDSSTKNQHYKSNYLY